MKKLLGILLIPFVLFACDALTGKEVGRLQFNKVSTKDSIVLKETTLDLKKGEEIGLWSEMDIEFDGDVNMLFRVEVLKDGVKVDLLEIDPTKKNISINEVQTSFNGKTKWSFTGKNKEITIDADGKYTFKGIFVATDNPSLKVNKAELVLKK